CFSASTLDGGARLSKPRHNCMASRLDFGTQRSMGMSGPETIEPGYAPIKAWVEGVPVEDAARRQLFNIAALPFIHGHVAVMPDVQLGKGATVGSVIATRGAIVRAAVGVDIGCGMMSVRTARTAGDLRDSRV